MPQVLKGSDQQPSRIRPGFSLVVSMKVTFAASVMSSGASLKRNPM
jgi:hypothetical protein